MLMRLLRRYLQPYRSMIIACVVLATLGTIGALYLPSLNASIIDEGVATGDTAFIWRTGVIMLAVSAVQIVCSIGSVYFGAKTAMAFGRDLRGAIFDRVLTFSARGLNRFGAPSLITRNTNDVQQVQMLVAMSATVLLSAPITMIGGIIMAMREDVGLSWLVVVAAERVAHLPLAIPLADLGGDGQPHVVTQDGDQRLRIGLLVRGDEALQQEALLSIGFGGRAQSR